MRAHLTFALALTLALGAASCGGAYYAASIHSAEARLDQARQAGAETTAPFEYYYAREHLQQAQREASQASYGDAVTYAETAETYAQKAIDVATTAKKLEKK